MKRKHIYIVEDNDDIRELIGYILEEYDFQISGYATAGAFSQQISQELPDLILLDIMLPDGNGIDICKKLKASKETSHIPVILMSANAHKSQVISEARAEDFISKPFDIDIFRHRVNEQLVK